MRNIPQVQDELQAQRDSDASLIADIRADGIGSGDLVDLVAHFTATSRSSADALADGLKNDALSGVVVAARGSGWTIAGTVRHVQATQVEFDREGDRLITMAATRGVLFEGLDVVAR